MIDPRVITNYKRNRWDLQEFAIFSVCVAGHNANNTAKSVDELLSNLQGFYPGEFPLDTIYQFVFDCGLKGLQGLFKDCGIGCHTGTDKSPGKAEICYKLAEKVIDNPSFLLKCSVADLEAIKGIGSKTARFFILHSRPKQRIAALDVHILKYLRDNGIKAPKTTPQKGSKRYLDLEQTFLTMCDNAGRCYAEMDLEIWNKYSLDGLENRAKMVGKRRTNGKDSKASAVA